ncbi:DEAD/DEAH box helicase [Halococcoides cellulosivorans]|uniref:DEAD/DEAH box helicase n=1 Tax=Halococcoides cellulosivorans TaxID=1679096 RepID=UPI0015749CA5|nr:DEAD/DEAH box helicase [Halococcoides cellulosivorans]
MSEEPSVDLDPDAITEIATALGRAVLTADAVADHLGVSQAVASDALDRAVERAFLDATRVEDTRVYVPADLLGRVKQERIVTFPDRREIVVDQPDQFTRAQLSQFARLADVNGSGGYRYEITSADVWAAPVDDADALVASVRRVLGGLDETLESWLRSQYERAHRFRLRTHDDGYVVLESDAADLMGNVARQQLDDHLRAELSDTESWVAEERVADLKRTLYEAGYPVQDDRDLEAGDPVAVDLNVDLRDYQQTWVDAFLDQGAGVLVGPPGSGKTVAAIAILAAIGGESLILAPGRELLEQWREELLARTDLDDSQIGLYHGDAKQRRPITIATYRTAAMDRHRHLFDDREWGLIVYDECHHVPADALRRSTTLQTRHRLGLTATPVRESDDEREIFSLIGPPIGTDWEALFDRGFVARPTVEIRYVEWDRDDRDAYVASEGQERRQLAASNSAKIDEIEHILAANPAATALIFADYLDQGAAIAERLDVPFCSGETPHHRRQALLEDVREGRRDRLVLSRVGDEGIDLPAADLAIVASGLGGSRRQGAQRAGRTMRPTGGARMVVLATRGTREEEFARNRTRHLAGKGVPVTERDAVTTVEE